MRLATAPTVVIEREPSEADLRTLRARHVQRVAWCAAALHAFELEGVYFIDFDSAFDALIRRSRGENVYAPATDRSARLARANAQFLEWWDVRFGLQAIWNATEGRLYA